jgi:hypothetical protein
MCLNTPLKSKCIPPALTSQKGRKFPAGGVNVALGGGIFGKNFRLSANNAGELTDKVVKA